MTNNSLLIYCDEYPPAKSGGIGSVTKIVAEALAQRGWKVFVAGSYEYGTKLPVVSTINSVEVYRFEYFGFLRFIPTPFRSAFKAFLRRTNVLSSLAAKALVENEKKIERLLLDHDIRVIELVDYISLLQEIKQPVQLQAFSVPGTLRIHGSVSFLNKNKGIFKETQVQNDQNNFARANRLSSVSDYSRTFVNEHLLKTPRIIDVIYNPIEDNLLVEHLVVKQNKTILFYGKIVQTKGAFQVLKAFQAIAPEFGDWKLQLIGGGDIALGKRLVDSTFRDRIVFTGYVNREQVIQSIDAAIFVVIPSYFENFSMAPLEVMARQTALIYTKRTSGKEIIIDGVNGLSVDPDNLQELQEKMIRLIQDEKLRAKLALAGLNTVKEKFTLTHVLDQLEQHYQSVIHE